MEGKIFFLSPCTFCQLQYSRNAIFHQGIHVDWSREIRNDVIFSAVGNNFRNINDPRECCHFTNQKGFFFATLKRKAWN